MAKRAARPRSLAARKRAAQQKLLDRGTADHYRDAALYDFEYKDRTDDVRWYRRLARERAGSSRILELGAGTGRVTCQLAEDRHDVLALDRMPEMLDALRERVDGTKLGKRIEVVQGEMTELRLPTARSAWSSRRSTV